MCVPHQHFTMTKLNENNVLYQNQSNGSKCVIDICRTLPTFEKTDLGHVRQQSVTWKKVNVKWQRTILFFIF
jgi:hypothetical protein